MSGDRKRAERVIVEIIRQAGGKIGKTKLFKTFWLAHLYYAKSAPGYLTDWPIVRMPKGPGIHRAESLIDELIEGGVVTRTYEPAGPFTEIVCRLANDQVDGELSEIAVEAVKKAVEHLRGHSADSISEESHDLSRSWYNTPDGQELQIYTDLIPDDAYDKRRKEMVEMKNAYEELFE